MIYVILLGWCACGVIAAGVACAHFQDSYPTINTRKEYRQDLGFGLAFGLTSGPIGLVLSILLSGFAASGWTLRYRNHTGASR